MAKKRAPGKAVSARSSMMVALPWVLVVILTAGLIASFYENRLALLQDELKNLEAETLAIRQELSKADEESFLLAEKENQEPGKTATNLIFPANNSAETTVIITEQVVADKPAEPDPADGLEPPPVEVKVIEGVSTTPDLQVAVPALAEADAEATVETEAIVYPEAKTQGRY